MSIQKFTSERNNKIREAVEKKDDRVGWKQKTLKPWLPWIEKDYLQHFLIIQRILIATLLSQT